MSNAFQNFMSEHINSQQYVNANNTNANVDFSQSTTLVAIVPSFRGDVNTIDVAFLDQIPSHIRHVCFNGLNISWMTSDVFVKLTNQFDTVAFTDCKFQSIESTYIDVESIGPCHVILNCIHGCGRTAFGQIVLASALQLASLDVLVDRSTDGQLIALFANRDFVNLTFYDDDTDLYVKGQLSDDNLRRIGLTNDTMNLFYRQTSLFDMLQE